MRRILVVLSMLVGSILTTNLVNTATVVAAGATGAYIPLSPTRVADTRPQFGNYGTPSVPKGFTANGDTLRIPVAGRAGVPKDASAVAINLTATQSLTPGFLTVYACNAERPDTSNINLQPGENLEPGKTVANLAITEIGATGDICIYSRGITHVVVDLNGYVPADASPILTAPTRIGDTRPGTPKYGSPKLPKKVTTDGGTLRIPVVGRAGIPSDATAVLVNLTATKSTSPGFLTAYACGTKAPDTSNINLQPGNTVANLAITELGTTGDICIYSRGITHVVVDLNGYVPADASPILTAPTRIGDTRPDTPKYGSPKLPKKVTTDGGTLRIPVAGRAGIPSDAAAVLVNLTATKSTSPGYLTVYACDTKVPDTSNINLQPGNTVANLAITELGTTGDICIYSRGITHVVVDLNGYVPAGPGTTSGCSIAGTEVDTSISQIECDALIAFYDATRGPNWTDNTGWNTPTDPCTWYGTFCFENELISIDLNNNNLDGEIPAEIGNLPHLDDLTLVKNRITKIPPEIGNLSNLGVFDVGYNEITTIPTEIGKLKKLRLLSAWGNQITTIPTEVGGLTSLGFLDLSKNRISRIPSELGNLPRISYFYIDENRVSAIPPELANARSLETFSAWDNKITSIPPEISKLTALTWLDLDFNQIKVIPPQIGRLHELQLLRLAGNEITAIPDEIGYLDNLNELDLRGNQISGDVSEALVPLMASGISFVGLTNNNCPTASYPEVAAWLDTISPGWSEC